MTRKAPSLGQTLYSANVGNALRNRVQTITPCIVTKIGRKYFTVLFSDRRESVEFHLENWREKTDYSSSHALYESEQEWIDRVESEKIRNKLRDLFSVYSYYSGVNVLTLQQLQSIMLIIEGEPHP